VVKYVTYLPMFLLQECVSFIWLSINNLVNNYIPFYLGFSSEATRRLRALHVHSLC
jgi:hypothetical protein